MLDIPKHNLDDELEVFLEKSVKGQKWLMRKISERDTLSLVQKLGLPSIVADLLVRRGITLDDAEDFLNPKLKSSMPDPEILKDMTKAVQRLYQAIIKQEKIVIFGDYDVDGATSSSLLKLYLRHIGIEAEIYIPDRIEEGYGPSLSAFESFVKQKVQLIVTVDCGTLSYEPLEFAASKGLDVIVLDHHKAEVKLPLAVAIVNPNRVDEPASDLSLLAAVGVTYLLLIALNRSLREKGYFETKKIQEPNMLSYLDLVALGTVCDVVPLKGLNRAFVSQGIKVMAKRENIGLKTLSDIAGLDEKPTPYHLGFVLGPRINAGGRVGESDLGSTLLTHTSLFEAQKIAKRLDEYNKERRDIEAQLLEEAIQKVEAERLYEKPIMLVSGHGWHPGVIGIVASRLKDLYWRPTCVIAFDENQKGKASGRSVAGLDLGVHILAAFQDGYLINGGGHAMAVGFTVEQNRLSELETYLIDRVMKDCPHGLPPRSALVDGLVSLGGVTLDLVQKLDSVGPFGAGHPEPLFVLNNVRIVKADVMGEDHLRCIVQGAGGEKNYMQSLTAVCFRCLETDLGQFLRQAVGSRTIHLLGKMKVNDFRGNQSVQFFIDDAAFA